MARGIVTFHFDDGHASHYDKAFKVFSEFGAVGCLCLIASEKYEGFYPKALEMQKAGWEIISHSVNHIRMNEPLPPETVETEIRESKKRLEGFGFRISEWVTPMSTCHQSMRKTLEDNYIAAFTRYTKSGVVPIENLVIEQPIDRFDLHRACLSGRSMEELKAYIDYVSANDAWLVFYEHDIGAGVNATEDTLRGLLEYCRLKDVAIETSAQVIKQKENA